MSKSEIAAWQARRAAATPKAARALWESVRRTGNRLLGQVSVKWCWTMGLFVITAVGAAVRLYLLGEKAIWWDEGWSMYLARKTPLQIIVESASTQHPPLHYLYLHYWLKVAGDGEFAARLSSILFGVATIPIVCLLGSRIRGRAVGLGAALFLALAPFHICWSQEIRMYSAATFFAALSFVLFITLLSRPRAAVWIGYALSTSAMLYLHYGTLLVVVIENLIAAYVFLRPPVHWRRFWAWIGCQASVALTLVPWLFLYAPRATEHASDPAVSPLLYVRLLATLFPIGQSTDLNHYLWITAGFSALAAWGLWRLFRERHLTGSAWLVPLLGLTLGPALVYVLSLPQSGIYSPRIVDRYLLIFLPLYAVALSAGLFSLARRSRAVAVVAGIVVVGVLVGQLNAYYGTRRYEPDPKAAGRLVQECFQAGDTVILNPDKDWPVYAYYLGGEIPICTIPYAETMTPDRAAATAGKVSASDTIWLIEAPEVSTNDPDNALRTALATENELLGESDFGNIKVWVFRNKSASCAFCPSRIVKNPPVAGEAASPLAQSPLTSVRAVLENGIHLESYSLGNQAPSAGSSLDITLVWSCAQRQEQNAVVFVHVLNSDGALAAQHDGAPVWGAYPTTAWACDEQVYDTHTVQLPPDLAPGRYRVVVGLYDRVTGERVHVVEGRQDPTSPDNVLVATFVVGGK